MMKQEIARDMIKSLSHAERNVNRDLEAVASALPIPDAACKFDP